MPSGSAELPLSIRVGFRDGDPDALARVYDRYQRAVWSVCVSVARSDQLAQEAVQETFIRAWRAAVSYDPERDLGPWLLTVARHATLDVIRRESRPTRGGHEQEQDAVIEDPGIEQVWTAWQVQEAIRQLGDEEREIIRLTFADDLSQSQVSQRLGIPLGTVKSRSHRAHRRLAELLAHLHDPPLNRIEPAERRHGGALRSKGRTSR